MERIREDIFTLAKDPFLDNGFSGSFTDRGGQGEERISTTTMIQCLRATEGAIRRRARVRARGNRRKMKERKTNEKALGRYLAAPAKAHPRTVGGMEIERMVDSYCTEAHQRRDPSQSAWREDSVLRFAGPAPHLERILSRTFSILAQCRHSDERRRLQSSLLNALTIARLC